METTQEQTFEDIGLEPFLVKALKTMSIKGPTEVQAACIPPILAGRDCIGNAQTGSGKTIAFAAPILQNLAQDPYGIYAVVLTPTRLDTLTQALSKSLMYRSESWPSRYTINFALLARQSISAAQ